VGWGHRARDVGRAEHGFRVGNGRGIQHVSQTDGVVKQQVTSNFKEDETHGRAVVDFVRGFGGGPIRLVLSLARALSSRMDLPVRLRLWLGSRQRRFCHAISGLGRALGNGLSPGKRGL